MKEVDANVFFIRGPPGTGKPSVITSLVCGGLFGHESKHDVKDLLPKSIKRIIVITHTNAAIDDVLKKISKMRSFKDGELVRVGVRESNEHFTAQRVYEMKVRREQRYQNVKDRRVRFLGFHIFDVINDASIVFSTFGSLQRTEFLQARSAFDMVVIEEAGKLHEGDITLGLAQSIGMKDSPEPGHPLAVVQVGDELQLPTHSSLDSNLKFPRLCADPFFKRLVDPRFRKSTPQMLLQRSKPDESEDDSDDDSEDDSGNDEDVEVNENRDAEEVVVDAEEVFADSEEVVVNSEKVIEDVVEETDMREPEGNKRRRVERTSQDDSQHQENEAGNGENGESVTETDVTKATETGDSTGNRGRGRSRRGRGRSRTARGRSQSASRTESDKADGTGSANRSIASDQR